MIALIFIFLLLTRVYHIICQNWDYHQLGPDTWSDFYPKCAGQFQSPIDIKTACTIYQTFTPFQFSSEYNLTYNFTLLNEGNGIKTTYNYGNSLSPFKLTGAGLNGIFHFLNFHLHWDENSKSGSEHHMYVFSILMNKFYSCYFYSNLEMVKNILLKFISFIKIPKQVS